MMYGKITADEDLLLQASGENRNLGSERLAEFTR